MTEETTAAPAAEAEAPAQEPARDFEAEAREIGWQPESEFKGPKERWKPAEQFVKDGENFLPILKANERKLRLELASERKSFADRLDRLNRVAQTTQERLVADYEERLQAIKDAQEKAVEAGDKDEFKRLEKKRDQIEARKPEDIIVDEPAKPDIDGKFKSNNPWYGTDEDMTAIAVGFSQRLAGKDNSLSVEENLRQTEQYMRQKYPALYGQAPKPAANGHAAVDGGGAFPGAGKSDPLNRLPNEARQQCKIDMQIKYKDGTPVYKTVESWIKAYEGKR